MTKEIVIVGAGFAGVAAAQQLGKTFKKDEEIRITLIDKHSYLTYMTELHEVAGGRVEPEAIKYDLRRLFNKYKNVDLVTDKVTSVDYDTKTVHGEQNTYQYDYLILAMGGEANTFGVEGVLEHGFTLWSIEAAERVRAHIINACYLASREHDPAKRRALLSFVVCGAGFTGVEMVGELVEWFDKLAHDYKLDRSEFSLHLVEAAPKILAMVTEKEQEKAMKYMQKVGINISLGDGIVKVAQDHIQLASGKTLPTYTTIWTAGVQANTETKDFGIEKARAGRLVANQYMEAKDHDKVYVVGDLVYFEEADKNNMPIPQIVQAAEQTGHTAALNIIADIKGTEKHAYKGKYDGFMVSIGSKYAVAFLNDKLHLSGWMATLVKHLVNLYYFFGIRSAYNMVAYTRHEFFDIENKRNVFGGMLSSKGNNLWLVPLRVFYGAMWLIEGLKKTFGWFHGSSWFGENVVFPFEWLQAEVTSGASAAEATSGASEVATEAVQQVFSLNYTYGEEPMLVLQKMPNWFASIMKFMMPNTDVALFMQKFMAIFEILIGLALIAGLFTWLISAMTVGLVTMFCLSGMFVWVNMWFIPAAIALMAGAGRAFGLDYWVMPWLGRILDRWAYGKTNHIYNDRVK
ncbi:TPA: FAD-dependent oxidoreductase [Streptococcus suis]